MQSRGKDNLGGTRGSKGREAGKCGPVWEIEIEYSIPCYLCKCKKCKSERRRKWEC